MKRNANPKSPKSKRASANTKSTQPQIQSYRAIRYMLKFPRYVRIAITTLFAVAVTLVIALLVFYESIFYTSSLLNVLMMVCVVFGLAMYVAGWQLYIGPIGETPPARLAVLWYVGLGALAIFLVLLWFLQGIIKGLL
jgi:hypothetical protein